MPKVTFDSDVFMKRKPTKLLQGFYMSAVVLEELAAGAEDGSVLKEMEAALKNYEKAGRLLVPTAEDGTVKLMRRWDTEAFMRHNPPDENLPVPPPPLPRRSHQPRCVVA
jgi:hypothetical protein